MFSKRGFSYAKFFYVPDVNNFPSSALSFFSLFLSLSWFGTSAIHSSIHLTLILCEVGIDMQEAASPIAMAALRVEMILPAVLAVPLLPRRKHGILGCRIALCNCGRIALLLSARNTLSSACTRHKSESVLDKTQLGLPRVEFLLCRVFGPGLQIKVEIRQPLSFGFAPHSVLKCLALALFLFSALYGCFLAQGFIAVEGKGL